MREGRAVGEELWRRRAKLDRCNAITAERSTKNTTNNIKTKMDISAALYTHKNPRICQNKQISHKFALKVNKKLFDSWGFGYDVAMSLLRRIELSHSGL